jgi:hypothetical protein
MCCKDKDLHHEAASAPPIIPVRPEPVAFCCLAKVSYSTMRAVLRVMDDREIEGWTELTEQEREGYANEARLYLTGVSEPETADSRLFAAIAQTMAIAS